MTNTAILVTLVGLTLALLMTISDEPTANVHHSSANSTKNAILIEKQGILHHGFCSLVGDKITSQPASQWWTSQFGNILNASQHPQDPDYVYRNWTLSLLASLSPEMLQQSVRARPSGHSFDHIADILHKRITEPRKYQPLKIAVVGGSVTRGQKCHEPVLAGVHRFDATLCAWPSRLERLINTLAGMELVKVYNLAVSATDLQFGTPLIKYKLYPQALLPDGPDVILSSYSTNEQVLHVDTTTSVKYANRERERIQAFITASRMTRPCRPPLVVFVDDYLGNRQDHIIGEMTFNKITTELAEWYGEVMHVSYADVVRRAVYANTEETIFTAPWPLETSGKYRDQPKVEVHFGMAGHVAIAWSFLYAMVDVLSGYCGNQAFVQRMKRDGHKGVVPSAVLDRMNAVPPPQLKPSLLLQNVSREWQVNAVHMREVQSGCNDDAGASAKMPCPFAFLAGPDATVRNPHELNDYLKPFLVSNEGWEPVMEYGAGGIVEKPGLIATRANASMTLRMTNISKGVRVINLQRIKSYGNKWAGSKAHFTLLIENPGKPVYKTEFDVDGYHSIKSSVSFSFQHDLKGNKAMRGSNMTLSIDLVGGTTFKIIGLMLCDE